MDDGLRALGSNSAPVAQWWSNIVDGARPWGSIDLWPNRYGFRKCRLVVFPPGIRATERRYLRLARSWPTWGAALWLTLAIVLTGYGWATVVYPTAALVLTGAVVFALSRSTHAHTRIMIAAVIDGYHDAQATARYAHLERLALSLVTADAMRASGELTLVQHEAIWWCVYDALDHDGAQLG